MRIVLVIFISTHDSLSSPLNHSAVVTSVIIRALTEETICQTQNSSWKSSLTTLWNNIHHTTTAWTHPRNPRWQRKKPVTGSITQVLLKVPVDLWLVITVDCGFHRSIAKTWWETGIITSCGPPLGAERLANSADWPHLIEFFLNCELCSGAQIQPDCLSEQSYGSTRHSVTSRSACIHVHLLSATACTEQPGQLWLVAVAQTVENSGPILHQYCTPSAVLVVCKDIRFAKCQMKFEGPDVFPEESLWNITLGGLSTAGSLSPCRLLQYDEVVISDICNSFAYSTVLVYSGGSLRGKSTTSEMYLFIDATDRLNQLFPPHII